MLKKFLSIFVYMLIGGLRSNIFLMGLFNSVEENLTSKVVIW